MYITSPYQQNIHKIPPNIRIKIKFLTIFKKQPKDKAESIFNFKFYSPEISLKLN